MIDDVDLFLKHLYLLNLHLVMGLLTVLLISLRVCLDEISET